MRYQRRLKSVLEGKNTCKKTNQRKRHGEDRVRKFYKAEIVFYFGHGW